MSLSYIGLIKSPKLVRDAVTRNTAWHFEPFEQDSEDWFHLFCVVGAFYFCCDPCTVDPLFTSPREFGSYVRWAH